MEKINVLWIEDQSESPLCKPFKLQASLKGLNLIAKEDWESVKDSYQAQIDANAEEAAKVRDQKKGK